MRTRVANPFKKAFRRNYLIDPFLKKKKKEVKSYFLFNEKNLF